jgi:hypothetical protein
MLDVLRNLQQLVGITSENAGELGALFAGLSIAIVLLIAALQTLLSLLPILSARRTKKELKHAFGADAFDEFEILEAIRFYVEPDCAQVDPSAEEDLRHIAAVRESVFAVVDRFLEGGRSEKHLLLLADSGMGKTSFLLNYYHRNRRRPTNQRQRIALIPLGREDALDRIKRVDQKRDTIIFLDAFDEDTEAIGDHRQRLRDLMEACADFRRVVMTCRTQFFLSDEEIPREAGVAIVAPRRAGVGRQYKFYKLYLLPLSDKQIQRYVWKRFGLWQRKQRQAALRIIASIPELSTRPMLLSVVPDLVKGDCAITELFELYEFMVESWLKRESSWIDKDRLRAFSETLAVDLYLNRKQRRFERISREDFMKLVQVKAADLDSWRLRARSLLNRDALGNYKFAHRSIMEWLFIAAFIKGQKKCRAVEWTDLMKQFFVSWCRARGQGVSESVLRMLEDTDFRKTRLFPMARCTRESAAFSKEACVRGNLENFNSIWPVFEGRVSEVLIRIREADDTILMCDFATDLAWLLPELEHVGEVSVYRVPQGELDSLLRRHEETSHFERDDWRLPTLEEFDILVSLYASVTKKKRVLKSSEFYWSADSLTGGGQIAVSVGLQPLEDAHVKYMGKRTVTTKAGRELGYHVYEVVRPYRPVPIEGQFAAQLVRVLNGKVEDLWYAIREDARKKS